MLLFSRGVEDANLLGCGMKPTPEPLRARVGLRLDLESTKGPSAKVLRMRREVLKRLVPEGTRIAAAVHPNLASRGRPLLRDDEVPTRQRKYGESGRLSGGNSKLC
jgi:hypothetical protein